MSGIDTSREAVERLAATLDGIHADLANDHAWSIDCHSGAATLRALLAERDAAAATIRDLRTSLDAERAHGGQCVEGAREMTADFMEAARLLMVAEAERDAALRDLAAAREALAADMYWMADDPERPESDPREHACVNGLCPGEYFEVSRAVSLGNAWAVVIPRGDDDDIDCEVVETEDAAKRRSNEIRAALAAQPAAEGTSP